MKTSRPLQAKKTETKTSDVHDAHCTRRNKEQGIQTRITPNAHKKDTSN